VCLVYKCDIARHVDLSVRACGAPAAHSGMTSEQFLVMTQTGSRASDKAVCGHAPMSSDTLIQVQTGGCMSPRSAPAKIHAATF